MKKIYYLIALLLINFSIAYPQTLLKWAADAESNAPYIFIDPKNSNKLIGFELEIAEQIAKQLNLQSKFVQNQWDGLIPGLYRGDYDIAINGLEITDDRKDAVNFSIPYYITYEQLITMASNSEINSLIDCKAKRVGALKASLAERILNEFGGINVKTYEGEINAILDLENGRLDAVLCDAPIALYYANWNKKFRLPQKPIGKVEYGIAIRKDDFQMLAKVNSALQTMINDGKLRGILEKWNLWNPQMAEYTNDFSESEIKPEYYNSYINYQLESITIFDKLDIYWKFMPSVAEAAWTTIYITVLSMLLAVFAGLILALLRIYAPVPISSLAIAFIEIIRGTPLLIQLFFIFYALPSIGIKLSPLLAAILGLGLNYAAYEAENYRAGLASVPRGQMEAALSLGMTRLQALRFVILPQALRIVVPPVTNDFISLLKDSSLVSVITLVELTKLYGQLSSTYYDYIGTGIIIATVYLLLGLPFVKLSRYVENRLMFDKRKII